MLHEQGANSRGAESLHTHYSMLQSSGQGKTNSSCIVMHAPEVVPILLVPDVAPESCSLPMSLPESCSLLLGGARVAIRQGPGAARLGGQ